MFKKNYIILFILFCSNALLYQNCGEQGFEARNDYTQLESDVEGDLDISDDENSKVKNYQAVVEAQPLYANRILMYNIFSSIFGPSIKNELVRSIAWASSEIGSGYNTYEKVLLPAKDCSKKRNALYRCDNASLERGGNPILGASAVREGKRMSACHLGVDNNNSFLFVLKKIDKSATLASPPEMTDKNLNRVFQLFFRGRPAPNKQVLDSLKIAYNKGEDATDGWRAIILGICLSPHWQVM